MVSGMQFSLVFSPFTSASLSLVRTSPSNIGQLETVNPASPPVLARDASNGPPGRCPTKILVRSKTNSLSSRCGTWKIAASYFTSTAHILGSDSGYHRRRWPIETVSDRYFNERLDSISVGVYHIVASFATSVCMNDGSFDFGRQFFSSDRRRRFISIYFPRWQIIARRFRCVRSTESKVFCRFLLAMHWSASPAIVTMVCDRFSSKDE